MKIIKKRIRNIETYLYEIRRDDEFNIGLTGLEDIQEKLVSIGFTEALNIGETILPKIVGAVSRYNADGTFIKRRDLPKEEYTISREWTWKDYQGNEYSKIVYITRERIHREPVPAPNIELSIQEANNQKILVAQKIKKEENNFPIIKHSINLLLELFGECDVLNSDLEIIPPANVIRLNWKIFPQGEYPWETVEPMIRDRIERQPRGNQPILTDRNSKISSKNPSFFAYGVGGFSDYTVYGFPEFSLFIFESMRTGNATYVFDKNWEQLSRLAKKEIIDDNLFVKRIIHKEGWHTEIDKLFA